MPTGLALHVLLVDLYSGILQELITATSVGFLSKRDQSDSQGGIELCHGNYSDEISRMSALPTPIQRHS